MLAVTVLPMVLLVQRKPRETRLLLLGHIFVLVWIAQTCPELPESCRKDSPLLRLRPFGPADVSAPPYCETVEFREVPDLRLAEYGPDTDYYIIALDSDEENLWLTDHIRRIVTRNSLETDDNARAVIAPGLEDSHLARAARNLTPKKWEPYVAPFGSLADRYSCKNVFLTSFTERDITIKSRYRLENQREDDRDIYATQSAAARAVHAPYKLFGLGLLRQADLTRDVGERYLMDRKTELTVEQSAAFSWIEHRRWNAYLRSRGFTCPTREQLDRWYAQTRKHKSIPLKLHPCLVEGGRSDLHLMPLDQIAPALRARYDYLGYASIYIHKLKDDPAGAVITDYKKHDFYLQDAAVRELLRLEKKPR